MHFSVAGFSESPWPTLLLIDFTCLKTNAQGCNQGVTVSALITEKVKVNI